MNVLKIKNLSKKIDNAVILDDINLEVKSGEIIMLIGRSGCGKSTLLNIIGGFLPFESGSIEIGGQKYEKEKYGSDFSGLNLADSKNLDSTNQDSKNLKSSPDFKLDSKSHKKSTILENLKQFFIHKDEKLMVKTNPHCIKIFQEYALMPWKSALNNVIFALDCNKDSKNTADTKAIAKKYLEIVGLKEHIHKFPKMLSGGQKQRVAIARALSLKPDILLLDEPFSALDYFIRENLQKLIFRLSREFNMTMIFVTHDIDEAIKLGDRIIVMRDGKFFKEIDNSNKLVHDSKEFLRLKNQLTYLLQDYEKIPEFVI